MSPNSPQKPDMATGGVDYKYLCQIVFEVKRDGRRPKIHVEPE